MYVCFSCLIGVVLLVKDCRMINLIMKYLVNISKRRAFWSLNEDILKSTILKTNTPYPSRKIQRIRACTHQRPQRKEDQYAISRRSQYAVSPNTPCPIPWIRRIEPTSRPMVRIFIKKDKNKAKTDKAEHENGKSVINRSRRRNHLLRTNPGPLNEP
ncbi:hypothetical protein Tco_1138373, partial [Tanacetum coccineum]